VLEEPEKSLDQALKPYRNLARTTLKEPWKTLKNRFKHFEVPEPKPLKSLEKTSFEAKALQHTLDRSARAIPISSPQMY